MWPIATDVTRSVVCVSVCVSVTRTYCEKSSEPIEMPFGADSCGSKEPCIRWGVNIGRIYSQPRRGDNSAMRPFAKLLCTLFVFSHTCRCRRPIHLITTYGRCRSERSIYSPDFSCCSWLCSVASDSLLCRTSRCASRRCILSCCLSGR